MHRSPSVPYRFACAALCLILYSAVASPASARGKKSSQDNGQVAGVVVDAQGRPVAGATVSLIVQADGVPVGSAATDKRGEFELTVQVSVAGEGETSPPGVYSLRLEAEGYAPFVNELSLSAGERLNFQITLLDAAAGLRNEAVAVYNEGVQLHAEGEFDRAAEKFRRAAEMTPDVPQPHLGLADVALTQGRLDEAAESIEAYLALQPDEPAGQRLAYEIYRALGRMDEAKQLAESLGIEAADKDLAIQVFNEGAIASQKGELDAALEKFERATQMDPELGPAWAGIASIHFNRRELEKAVEPAARAVELQPDHESSRRIHFLVLDGLGKVEAAEAWEAYRAMNQPAALELLYLRADLDFRNDGIESAKLAAQKILSIDAEYASAHLLLGKIHSSTDVALAKAHLQKFLELAPEDDPDLELAQSMIGYLE